MPNLLLQRSVSYFYLELDIVPVGAVLSGTGYCPCRGSHRSPFAPQHSNVLGQRRLLTRCSFCVSFEKEEAQERSIMFTNDVFIMYNFECLLIVCHLFPIPKESLFKKNEVREKWENIKR